MPDKFNVYFSRLMYFAIDSINHYNIIGGQKIEHPLIKLRRIHTIQTIQASEFSLLKETLPKSVTLFVKPSTF